MSLQTDLEALDTRFRRRQIAMQGGVKLGVSRLFQAIPVEEAMNERSLAVEHWVDVSTTLTSSVERRLARDSRDFYTSIANLMGSEPPVFADPDPVDLDAIRTSLSVTGVVGLRKRVEKLDERQTVPAEEGSLFDRQQRLIRQGDLQTALATSGDAAGGAAARHAGDGARNQIQDTARLDVRTVGFIRITSSRPCYFCAMLASRGPVYKEDSFEMSDLMFTGAGRHKVHDNCGCSMRPVYTRKTEERPAINNTLEDMWASLSRNLGRAPTLEDWRSYFNARMSARV